MGCKVTVAIAVGVDVVGIDVVGIGRAAATAAAAAESEAFALKVDHAQSVSLHGNRRRSPGPTATGGQVRGQMAGRRLQVGGLAGVFANDLVEQVFAAPLEEWVAKLDGPFRVENFLKAVRVELAAHGPEVAVLEVHGQDPGFNALFGGEVNGLAVFGPVDEARVELGVVENVVSAYRGDKEECGKANAHCDGNGGGGYQKLMT